MKKLMLLMSISFLFTGCDKIIKILNQAPKAPTITPAPPVNTTYGDIPIINYNQYCSSQPIGQFYNTNQGVLSQRGVFLLSGSISFLPFILDVYNCLTASVQNEVQKQNVIFTLNDGNDHAYSYIVVKNKEFYVYSESSFYNPETQNDDYGPYVLTVIFKFDAQKREIILSQRSANLDLEDQSHQTFVFSGYFSSAFNVDTLELKTIDFKTKVEANNKISLISPESTNQRGQIACKSSIPLTIGDYSISVPNIYEGIIQTATELISFTDSKDLNEGNAEISGYTLPAQENWVPPEYLTTADPEFLVEPATLNLDSITVDYAINDGLTNAGESFFSCISATPLNSN